MSGPATTDLDGLRRRLRGPAGAPGARSAALVAVAAAVPVATLEPLVGSVLRPGDVLVPVPDGLVVLCDRLGGADDAMLIAARVDAAVASTGSTVRWTDDGASATRLDAALAALGLTGDGAGRAPDGAVAHPVTWHVVDDGVRDRARERERLETALRRALEGDELRLAYQPVVALSDRRLVGLEALARWRHRERDVPPSTFVPLAEERGLIGTLGARLLDRALVDLVQLHRAGVAGDVRVGVNLSGHQLLEPDVVSTVGDALDRSGVEPSLLWLELTESVLLDDLDVAAARLEDLARLGVRLLLDDFGTGHSSLTWLRRLPVHALKLDRSFVAGVVEPGPDAAIVAAVVDLAASLGLECVAEGVEHPAQLDALVALGCRTGQGSLFGDPLPPAAVPGWVAAGGAGPPR